MTSPTEQRRAFDAAIHRYKAGDTTAALAGFADVTDANPAMSDAWLGRIACGDTDLDTLAEAHRNSRALYRETRRIGFTDGELHAVVNAPLYMTHPVWSRASIAMAYAGALIGAQRWDEAAEILDDPVLTSDAQAAQWRQFLQASLFHQTRRWTDVRAVTAVCPPPTPRTSSTRSPPRPRRCPRRRRPAWGNCNRPWTWPPRSPPPTRMWPPTWP